MYLFRHENYTQVNTQPLGSGAMGKRRDDINQVQVGVRRPIGRSTSLWDSTTSAPSTARTSTSTPTIGTSSRRRCGLRTDSGAEMTLGRRRLVPLVRMASFLAVILFMAGASRARAAERVGTVAELEGRPEVLRAGDATWSPLAVGDPVQLGDQLRTPADAKLLIVLREDSVLTLGPGSQLVITEQVLAPAGVVALPAPARHHQGGRHRALRRAARALRGRDADGDRRRARHQLHRRRYDPSTEETLVVGIEHVTRVRGAADAPGAARSTSAPAWPRGCAAAARPLAPAAAARSRLRSLRPPPSSRGGAGARQASESTGRASAAARRTQRAFSTEEQAVDQPLFKPPRAEAATPAAAHRSRAR